MAGQPFPQQERECQGRAGQLAPVQITRTLFPRHMPRPVSGPHWTLSLFYKGKRLHCVSTRPWEIQKSHRTPNAVLSLGIWSVTQTTALKTKVCLPSGGIKTEFCKMKSYPNERLKRMWEESQVTNTCARKGLSSPLQDLWAATISDGLSLAITATHQTPFQAPLNLSR